jgi:cysteine desulfuration protein SufE
MSITEKEQEIIEEFELFGEDWEMKYDHLIDLGKSVPLIKVEYKTTENLIQGCQSLAWLHAEKKNGRMIYTADSEGKIPKGLVALMIRVLSNEKPEDIVNAKLEFMDKIGLREHLLMTRENGLVNMINRMKKEAILKIEE